MTIIDIHLVLWRRKRAHSKNAAQHEHSQESEEMTIDTTKLDM